MTIAELQEAAYNANIEIFKRGLAILTWGNASAFDVSSGLIAIKPSGVPYAELAPENMVVLDVASGSVIGNGKLRPSSDTATHRALYNAFPQIGGIVHTHSRKATAWAQAGRDIPCFGTTQADHFYGAIPCTVHMTIAEVEEGEGYEHNTGLVIIRTFQERNLDPLQVPGVLVHGHAPFAWGESAVHAVENATVLEEVASMALDTLAIQADTTALSPYLLDKHFLRKHGATAYYGQSCEHS